MGYYAMDSRGSHGIADVAIWKAFPENGANCILVQCKLSKTGMSNKDMAKFRFHCKKYGCEGLFAYREGKKLLFLQLA